MPHKYETAPHEHGSEIAALVACQCMRAPLNTSVNKI